MKFGRVGFLVGMMCAGLSAMSDERVLPKEIFEAMGFHAVTERARNIPTFSSATELSQELAWPVTFKDQAHTIAQNYLNFQDYGGGAYFHKGCDLRAAPHSEVITPVEGILEGGYYGYDTLEDGSQTKFWKPWNGFPHPDPYFELAIVTDSGQRFEFHHVDVMDLPAETTAALNKGGVRLLAGTYIGKVLQWDFESYDHIHYNVFEADGTILNPEAMSRAVLDTVAPRIQGVYALSADGRVVDVLEGTELEGELQEIVVATTESRNEDAYVQTPPFAELIFDSGEKFHWDFRDRLRDSAGGFPDIRQVFLSKLRLPSGQILKTSGNYGKGLFLMRLPVPVGAHGAFTVRVGDTAGNERRVSAKLR